MLELRPITLKAALPLIKRWHRHHKPPTGGLFAVSCAVVGGEVCGVAIVGRPSARMLQDGFTAEVTRVATDESRNACSMLYGAAWRACRALGYRKLITYTLPDEGGASLRASGWTLTEQRAGGGSWSRQTRLRFDSHPTGEKLRWERCAG